jgi:hypothetical protein
VLAFSIYIIRLLATVIRLPQQNATFALEALGIIAKPVFNFTEAVDKRLLIAVLQQGNRLTKTLLVTIDQRQIVA